MQEEDKKELEIQEEKDKEKNRRKYVIFFLIFIVLFFFSVFGLTYSIYKGDNGGGNQINTGEIIFSYVEVDHAGNGIDIKDAMPLPDEVGKTLLASKQYFDFNVTATSKNVDIAYKLLIKKSDVSTLSNNNLRIYLVSLSGSFEQELVLKNFNELKKETIDGTEYYVLYEKTLNKGVDHHTDYYRLRIWVKEDADDFLEKTFSLKVAAHAVQAGD